LFTSCKSTSLLTEEDNKQLQIANDYFEQENYIKALEIYQKLYPKDSLNPEINYKIGVCYFDTKIDKYKAFKYFKTAYEKGLKEASFYLAWSYQLQVDLEKAENLFTQYLKIKKNPVFTQEEVQKHLEEIEIAKYLIENKLDVEIINLGPNINTKFPEYTPLLNADESMIIFTSRREDSFGGKKDAYNQYFEDVYVSYKNEKTEQWEKAKNIGDIINTPTHDAAVGLSADGNTLIIYRTSDDSLSGDLYYSVFEDSSWSVPVKFPEPINSSYNESSAALSSDGNMIIFSSDRPGGYGGKDLYVIRKLPTGEWSLPMNLGKKINSEYDEDAPFLLGDDRTMYYSSQKKSMGGYDIFKAHWISNTLWSMPQNVGYPINTTDDDVFFSLSPSGAYGYFSSYRDKNNYGSYDLYKVIFETDIKDLVIIKLNVLNHVNTPIRAKIQSFEFGENAPFGIYYTNKLTGKALLILDKTKDYIIDIEAEGMKKLRQKVSFLGIKEKELQKTIRLKPAQNNE
jgi:hypothetical protein